MKLSKALLLVVMATSLSCSKQNNKISQTAQGVRFLQEGIPQAVLISIDPSQSCYQEGKGNITLDFEVQAYHKGEEVRALRKYHPSGSVEWEGLKPLHFGIPALHFLPQEFSDIANRNLADKLRVEFYINGKQNGACGKIRPVDINLDNRWLDYLIKTEWVK